MNIHWEGNQYMSNILVTGGAGFVGSHLCERLVLLGHSVVSLDNYFTGSVENHIPGVEYVVGSTEQIRSLLSGNKFEFVYHFGEYSRVEQSFDDIDFVWQFNKIGTYEVLQFVRDSDAKLIYAGSSTKFADETDGYIPSPYTWSKASNTELVKQYAQWFSIPYAITYFYNVYGKREIKEGKYATLIAKYKTLSAAGSSLPVVLPGTQIRNFTHIDDIVDALILIGEYGHGDEYGIGSPEAFTVLEVAELFGLPIEYMEPRKGNRMSAKVVTDKTRALGWTPKRDLKTYITILKQNGWKDA
jgi:UDP-glucose 4-epimerase